MWESGARLCRPQVARAVAARAYDAGVATELPRPRDLKGWARELMYNPKYRPYR